MSVEAAKSNFFNADHYAVVGASNDPSKFGNRVFKWYTSHGFEATPVHPKEPAIENIPTIKDISDLKEPKSTSISVITPPKITLPLLKTALQELSVNGVWIQPGAEDGEVVSFVDSLSDQEKRKVILGGPCILVQGETLAKEKGKL